MMKKRLLSILLAVTIAFTSSGLEVLAAPIDSSSVSEITQTQEESAGFVEGNLDEQGQTDSSIVDSGSTNLENGTGNQGADNAGTENAIDEKVDGDADEFLVDDDPEVSEDEEVQEDIEEEKLLGAEAPILSETSLQTGFYTSSALGQLFTDKIQTVTESEEQTYDGNNISDITVQGKTATVEYSIVSENARIIVAIYDEETDQMLGSGSADLDADEETADVQIEITEMPLYFVLKAYMIDADSLSPIGNEYKTELYTREMQEFLQMTTDDFDEELVVNFDDDKKTNYAVLGEEVVVVGLGSDDYSETMTVSVNEETGAYIFYNATESVKNLEVGQTFYYEDASEVRIALKVASIEYEDDGNTVIIQSDHISLEEVFDYVRIDVTEIDEEPELDFSEVEDSEYFTVVDSQIGNEEPRLGASGKASASLSYTFSIGEHDIGKKKDKEEQEDPAENKSGVSGKVMLGGSVTFEINIELKVYVTLHKQTITYSSGNKYEMELELSGTGTGKLAIPSVQIPFLGGAVIAYCKPSITLKASASIKATFTYEKTSGFTWENKIGVTSKESKPKFSHNMEGEFSLKLTFDMKVGAKLLGFINFDMKPSVGLKLTMKTDGKYDEEMDSLITKLDKGGIVEYKDEDERHECDICYAGEVDFTFDLSFSIGFKGLLKNHEFELKVVSLSIKLMDFYYSQDHKEWGWFRTCPYKQFKYTINVYSKGTTLPVEGAHVTVYTTTQEVNECVAEDYTDKDGVITCWLDAGRMKFSAAKDDERSKDVIQNTANAGGSIKLFISSDPVEDSPADDIAMDVDGGLQPYTILTKHGDLWVWGPNSSGKLGTGDTDEVTTPKKVASDVKKVIYGENTGNVAIIKNDGSLWISGNNTSYQLANGSTKNSCYFVQIDPEKLTDVVDFRFLGYACAALTASGDVYTWGSKTDSGFYKDSSSYIKEPRLLLSGIVRMAAGNWREMGCVIDQNGHMKVWGGVYLASKNGNDNSVIDLEPKGPIDDIQINFDGNEASGAYLTTCGELYTWGNCSGSISIEDPYKVSDDVECFSTSTPKENHLIYLKKDGQLRALGRNYCGELGNGVFVVNHYVQTTTGVLVNDIPGIKKKIKAYCMDYGESAVLTENGQLYVWGDQFDFGLGVRSSEVKYTNNHHDVIVPTLLLEDVEDFVMVDITSTTDSLSGGYAVMKDGSIQIWGGMIPKDQRESTTDSYKLFSPHKLDLPGVSEKLLKSSIQESDDVHKKYISDNGTTIGDIGFKELVADCLYNIYVVKDYKAQDVTAADNLLYVGQNCSDAQGNISFTYNMREYYQDAVAIISGANQESIDEADITVSNVTYDGEEHFAQVKVTLHGKVLEEGIDYYLTGEVRKSEAGQYTIGINGKGLYYGSVITTWYIDDGETNYLKAYSVSLEGNLQMNFYTFIQPKQAVNGTRMSFKLADDTVLEKDITEAQKKRIGGIDYYRFTLDIPAKRIGDKVTIKLLLKDGTEGFTYETSVKNYAEYIIRNRSNEAAYDESNDLAKALLNYGTYAQKYFDYQGSGLANASLTEDERNFITQLSDEAFDAYAPVVSGEDEKLVYRGSSLLLESGTAIRHYFKLKSGAKISDYTFTVCKKGEEESKQVLVPSSRLGNYYVDIPDISSADLDTTYILNVGDITVQYSALSYGNEAVNKSKDKTLLDLVKALYLYNYEADWYFDNE